MSPLEAMKGVLFLILSDKLCIFIALFKPVTFNYLIHVKFMSDILVFLSTCLMIFPFLFLFYSLLFPLSEYFLV